MTKESVQSFPPLHTPSVALLRPLLRYRGEQNCTADSQHAVRANTQALPSGKPTSNFDCTSFQLGEPDKIPDFEESKTPLQRSTITLLITRKKHLSQLNYEMTLTVRHHPTLDYKVYEKKS